ARTEARKRFGNVATIEEQSHDSWGLRWVEHAISDARFAVRRLRNRPAFTFSAIAVIALGIGAATAVFSAVDAALIRPLPFLRPWGPSPGRGVPLRPSPHRGLAPGEPHSVAVSMLDSMPGIFSSVAAFASGGLNLSDTSHPRRVAVGVVTAGFFSTLGVSA